MFRNEREYIGPTQLVVLDWAGTAVDHGCIAPVRVFQRAFESRGVAVSEAEVREPMGMEKWAHFATMCAMPSVKQRWIDEHGSAPTDRDIDGMYAQFLPLLHEVVREHCAPIPGVVEAVGRLRDDGIKIGSSTGYPGDVMDIVAPLAAERGYAPDAIFHGGSAPVGRPAPFLIFENMKALDVHPIQSVIKVDDTIAGIEAGLNAGVYTVGVAATGNLVGRTSDALDALEDEEYEAVVAPAREKLYRAGAHLVIDSLAQLPDALEEWG